MLPFKIADIIGEPLTQAINCCLRQGIFPENAKVSSVVPLDKGKPDKYDVLNYRPVSILNAFSKIYEKVIKNQLASYLDKYFSPFISAYRKSYSTQQVLIRLLEEWREKLDKNFIVGAVLMDLSKAFDCIPHDLIISKLAAYGFKAGKVKMNVYRLRNLCVEIYKTINKLNPEFMNNIFKVKENKRVVREQYKLNLETPEWNQVTFGAKSLKVYGSKVWNSLPSHIKTSENLIQFKSLIKNWNGKSCSCTVCTK